MAMTGSGQPTARRVASSSSDDQHRADATTSAAGDCRPGRRARRRSTARRGSRRRDRERRAPSRRGRCRPARTRSTRSSSSWPALRGGEDEEDQPEHEGEMDAAMGRLAQQPEAGRVVVEHRQREEQAATTIRAAGGAAAGSASRDRTSPRGSRAFGIVRRDRHAPWRKPRPVRRVSTRRPPGGARRWRRGGADACRAHAFRQAGFPVELLGAGMDRDAGACERRLLADEPALGVAGVEGGRASCRSTDPW